jgi:hypothetical protein
VHNGISKKNDILHSLIILLSIKAPKFNSPAQRRNARAIKLSMEQFPVAIKTSKSSEWGKKQPLE